MQHNAKIIVKNTKNHVRFCWEEEGKIFVPIQNHGLWGKWETLSKTIRLVIDSIVDDLARIRLSSGDNQTTLSVTVDSLEAILVNQSVDEGKTFLVTLQNLEDYKDIWSGTFDSNFQFRGNRNVEDTTQQDLKKIRKRLKRLRRLR